MSLRKQLQTIYDDRGELTPRVVLEEARDKTHPLHERFEWDNAVAGEAFRLDQAHRLITSVKITFKKGNQDRTVRAFHAVRGDSPSAFVYEPVEKVATDDFLTTLVRREMERDWKQLKARYAHFDEFVQMIRDDVA